MKTAYDFTTEIYLGLMGWQKVDVSYSYDPTIHCLNLMAVYLRDGDRLGPEITDYLNGHGEAFL